MKLKYLINQKIDRNIGVESISKLLQKQHGISRSTFHRDRNIKLADDGSIPISRLEVYAALFDCTVDELKNYKTKRINPLKRKPLTKVKAIASAGGKLIPKLIVLAILLTSCVSYKGVGKCASFKTTPMHRVR